MFPLKIATGDLLEFELPVLSHLCSPCETRQYCWHRDYHLTGAHVEVNAVWPVDQGHNYKRWDHQRRSSNAFLWWEQQLANPRLKNARWFKKKTLDDKVWPNPSENSKSFGKHYRLSLKHWSFTSTTPPYKKLSWLLGREEWMCLHVCVCRY